MAEESRQRRGPEGDRSDGVRPRGRTRGLKPAELAKQAREELSEITGLEPMGVTSLEKYDDGTWTVVVELLELPRIPEAHDVLGSYEVDLDEEGHVTRYQRLRRYIRGDKDKAPTLGDT